MEAGQGFLRRYKLLGDEFSAPSLLEMKLGLLTTHLKPISIVKGEVEKWTNGLAGNYFEEGIKKLNPRLTTCIQRNGDSVEIYLTLVLM